MKEYKTPEYPGVYIPGYPGIHILLNSDNPHACGMTKTTRLGTRVTGKEPGKEYKTLEYSDL